MLALTGKLMVKDRLTRKGAAGFAKRGDHMGVGLVGRTLGSLGIGNIGAELFRLAKPFDMRFIAHDPFADASWPPNSASSWSAWRTYSAKPTSSRVSCPLTPADASSRQRRTSCLDEADEPI